MLQALGWYWRGREGALPLLSIYTLKSTVKLWITQLFHVLLHLSKENFQIFCLHFEDEKAGSEIFNDFSVMQLTPRIQTPSFSSNLFGYCIPRTQHLNSRQSWNTRKRQSLPLRGAITLRLLGPQQRCFSLVSI